MPVYHTGARAVAMRTILPLGIAVEDLPNLSLERAPLSGKGMAELWRMRQQLSKVGGIRAELGVELATRASLPFVMLVFSLFAAAFGWSLRGRWPGRTPALAFLAAPVIVLAAGMLVQLILYAHRVLLGFVVLSLGLSGAAVTLGVLELLLVAGSLAVLAGQTTSNP